MSLSRPSAVLSVDGRKLTAREAALVRLTVNLTSSGAHDTVQALFWPNSKFAGTAPAAKMELALGNAGDEKDVWTGTVTSVRDTPTGIALEGLASTAALNREYKSQSYVSQSIADIVRDLAGAVAVDAVESDIHLDIYTVDNRRSVWGHLQTLARLSGTSLGCSAAGGLRFTGASGLSLPKSLRHGADILSWNFTRHPAEVAPEVAAHRAASEAGSQRWHWLRNDPVGSGAPRTRALAALSTRDAAGSVGAALADRGEGAKVAGDLLLVGNPQLRPGDTVKLADFPGNDPGTLRVVTVEHRLDAATGFITRIWVEATSGGAGGLPL
jgi:hypothetical protein